MKYKSGLAWMAAALICCIGWSVVWVMTSGLKNFTSESWRRADVLTHPRALPVAHLEDHMGHEHALDSLCQQVLVVDFIYTRCNTVCRSQGATTSQLAKRLSDLGKSVQVMSVSFDPKHDTAASLLRFKRQMEPSHTAWTLARVQSEEETTALLKTFGVVVVPDGNGGFEHNSALHVVNHCQLVQVLDTDDMTGTEKTVRALASNTGV